MCGIAGVRRFDSEPVSRELLANMVARLLHRGPGDTGIWTQGDVGFAHTRLSIIDGGGDVTQTTPDGFDRQGTRTTTYLCTHLDRLTLPEIRTAIELAIDTGQPAEIAVG